jgi:hypothetical protein
MNVRPHVAQNVSGRRSAIDRLREMSRQRLPPRPERPNESLDSIVQGEDQIQQRVVCQPGGPIKAHSVDSAAIRRKPVVNWRASLQRTNIVVNYLNRPRATS